MRDKGDVLQTLTEAALKARLNSRSPYSGFKVGAALEDSNGKIWTGCNIESSSFGLTICAERVALTKALSEGADGFERLLIAASSSETTYPCGACLQLLHDYAPGIEVILYNPDADEVVSKSLSELFPFPFDDKTMKSGGPE